MRTHDESISIVRRTSGGIQPSPSAAAAALSARVVLEDGREALELVARGGRARVAQQRAQLGPVGDAVAAAAVVDLLQLVVRGARRRARVRARDEAHDARERGLAARAVDERLVSHVVIAHLAERGREIERASASARRRARARKKARGGRAPRPCA